MPLIDSDDLESTQESSKLWNSIVIAAALFLFTYWVLKYLARPRYVPKPSNASVWNVRPNNSATNEPVRRRFVENQARALGQPVTDALLDDGVAMMSKSDAHIQGKESGTMQDRHFVSTSWLRAAVKELVTNPNLKAHNEFLKLLGLINPNLVPIWIDIYNKVSSRGKKIWNHVVTPTDMQKFLDDLQNSEANRAIWDTAANQLAGNRLDISAQTSLQHAPGHVYAVARQYFHTSNALRFRPRVEGLYIEDDITRGPSRLWQVNSNDLPIHPREILGYQTWLIAYIQTAIDKLFEKN
ncbi:hypothetical protein SAMN05216404_11524 [Nitrosospira multiformis]|uniref:Uncharacterized protein n=1 Tax=Nitrosospira multiformis TaxID=1231 RepID=A0A1H8N4X0_9PROT|nr:hypothetical protein [Nitrosospira multiformis]SEO24576.1 hypothetical protein SAMN05216404_11524 [Nitrosospira multiformis]